LCHVSNSIVNTSRSGGAEISGQGDILSGSMATNIADV